MFNPPSRGSGGPLGLSCWKLKRRRWCVLALLLSGSWGLVFIGRADGLKHGLNYDFKARGNCVFLKPLCGGFLKSSVDLTVCLLVSLRASEEAEDAWGEGLAALPGKRSSTRTPEPGAVFPRQTDTQEQRIVRTQIELFLKLLLQNSMCLIKILTDKNITRWSIMG